MATKKPTTRVAKKPAAPVAPAKIARRKISADNYFASGNDKDLDFVSSGCELFDQMLGGGYVLGRIVNIVGDKSSGKTLQAIEACANFARQYPDGKIRYAEAESAFDQNYAEALGMPITRITFPTDIFTVEDWYEDLVKYIDDLAGTPALYIIDSLDALSDRAELDRDIDKGSYGMAKPKLLGELFRRLIQKIETAKILVMVISQIRDKIGVSFGETKTRSGGKALDFYASQIIWLAEVEKKKKVINKVERIIGIQVMANCKKNKIGLPFRKVSYPLLFGYGVDDLTANTEWLVAVDRLQEHPELGLSAAGYKVRINSIREKGGDEVRNMRAMLNAAVRKQWKEIETQFLPSSKKY